MSRQNEYAYRRQYIVWLSINRIQWSKNPKFIKFDNDFCHEKSTLRLLPEVIPTGLKSFELGRDMNYGILNIKEATH